MDCPHCGTAELRVLESRPARDGQAIRRRRQCLNCARRYTTFEEIERMRVFVVKRDGTRVEFNREKIVGSMMIPCGKRPVTMDQIRGLAEDIERDLQDLGDEEVTTREIAERVMGALWRIDRVAFVRFASVYGRFSTPDEFVRLVEEVSALQALTDAPPPQLVTRLHGDDGTFRQPTLPL